MSPTGEPITRCPVCRYNLTGLPAKHRCPKCGFEYDEATRLWNLRTRWYFVLVGVPLGICVVVFIKVLTRMLVVGVRPWKDLIDLIMFVWSVVAFIRILNSPSFIVVGQKGILAHLPDGRPIRYAWSDLVLVPDRRVVVRRVNEKLKPIAFTSLLSRERRESLRATCLALKPVDGGVDADRVE